MADAQLRVVASKFAREKKAPARRLRPPLSESYGESHLLLLARDPQTLFAAWDISPLALGEIKARIGGRGFAVSALTLRLSSPSATSEVLRLGKKARSAYLKIDGGPSFVAEIGLTTPAGRFEFLARSAPCFVPSRAEERPEASSAMRRAVLGYREAWALARSQAQANPSGTPRTLGTNGTGAYSNRTASSSARVLGGASDLHRR